MSRLKGLLRQLRVLTHKRRVERELDEEMAFHLQMETEKNLRAGMPAAQARRAALVSFGGVERTKERVRAARWVRLWEDLLADLRYALRFLRRSPGFVAVAVLTLGLGLGANSTLYGMVHALVSRMPTGVPASDALVWVDVGEPIPQASWPDFVDLADAADPLMRSAAFAGTAMAVSTAGGDPRSMFGQLVSGGYFGVLRVPMGAGRGITPDDDRRGAPPVAVLAWGAWQDLLGGREDAVGSVVRVNGTAYTVVGVAPRGFVGLDLMAPTALWVPAATQPASMPRGFDLLESRSAPFFRVVGRLRPGASREAAQAALDAEAARIEAAAGDDEHRMELHPRVSPLTGWVRTERLGSIRPTIAAASAVTLLVLLLACANVANLLLARAVTRRREMAVRLSLGASRGRVARQLVTEGLVLFLIAAGVTLLVTGWAARLFQARVAGSLAPLDVSPDAGILAFTLALATGAGVLCGLVPALASPDPAAHGLMGARSAGSLRRTRAQSALVVAQVALSFVLLFTAVLFVRRLREGERVPLGFDEGHVLAASFDLSPRGYDRDATATYYRDLTARVRALPGVRVASGPGFAPFGSGAALTTVAPAGEGESRSSSVRAVSAGVSDGYFRTLGIPIIRGRAIDRGDVDGHASVAVVSASLARALWGDGDPLGRELVLPRGRDAGTPLHVVGVAGEIIRGSPHETLHAMVYLPPDRAVALPESMLLVRAERDPAALAAAVRRAAKEVDPVVPLVAARPLESLVRERTAPSRAITAVLSGFGVLALALAALGLFGVVAFVVAGRGRDIAVRMALGADAGTVVAHFVHDGARLALVGTVLGTVLALAFGRILAAVVEGLGGADPATALATAAVLAGVAVTASWLPARRAARVDPMRTLQSD